MPGAPGVFGPRQLRYRHDCSQEAVSADYKGEEVIDKVGSGLSSQRLFVDDRFSTGFRNQSDAALMELRARAVRGVKSKTLCANSRR